MKRIFAIFLVAIFALTYISSTQASAAVFSGTSHADGLNLLVEKGALQKEKDGKYYPNRKVTRAEFAYFIAKVLELPDATGYSFKDVLASNRFNSGIQSAAAAGIVTGYTETNEFKPTNYITRQHMAVMLDRALDYLEIDKKQVALTFNDTAKISKVYRDEVATGVALGLIKGYENNNFGPQNNATIAQSATFIYRMVKYVENLTPATNTYDVYSINNGQYVKTKSYSSFEEAFNAMTNLNAVIRYNGDVVAMSSGIVVAKKPLTIPISRTDKMSVDSNTEMDYVHSDGKYVELNIGGKTAELSIDEVVLIPNGLDEPRSYYQNVNGELIHTIYLYNSSQYDAPYTIGKAPNFMNTDKKYYSTDGITFTDIEGRLVGEAYNYYQFLPARTTTSYTAEEINTYILKELKEREVNNSAKYAGASKTSKLLNIGETLKEIESQYKINPILILSVAMNESTYGMSSDAQEYNNLFGIDKISSDVQGATFESVEECLMAFAEMLDSRYISPSGDVETYGYGAVLGSKALGFNVKYAADPYWGSKAAGHYYAFDKAHSFKDANLDYKIGFTIDPNYPYLNVRTSPEVAQGTLLFSYKRFGLPVLIYGKTSSGWHKIASDKLYEGHVYMSGEYVREQETIK